MQHHHQVVVLLRAVRAVLLVGRLQEPILMHLHLLKLIQLFIMSLLMEGVVESKVEVDFQVVAHTAVGSQVVGRMVGDF